METPKCPIKPLSLDEAIAHADEVAGDCGTACKREHKQLADWLRELKARRGADPGDSAKLHEALEALLNLAYEVEDMNRDSGPRTGMSTKFVIDTAKAALAAPPRNCDVGTPREQADRAFAFCLGRSCETCEFTKLTFRECTLAWAQLPCGKGGAK